MSIVCLCWLDKSNETTNNNNTIVGEVDNCALRLSNIVLCAGTPSRIEIQLRNDFLYVTCFVRRNYFTLAALNSVIFIKSL